MTPQDIKNIYLIAICGTGMASLAGLLKDAGFNVSGSDSNIYPPMSTLLERQGIEIKPGYRAENVPAGADLVIIGNAVSRDNPEAEAVLSAGLAYTSFPEALARFFLAGRKSLVVAGTHGKTTTTSLLSWVLHQAGQKPGFMVGGWLKNFDGNYRVPGGPFFVTEGDEYDTAFFDKGAKFLHYRPHGAILTGVEFDHADIFKDLDHMKSAFRKFVELIPEEGRLLVKFDDTHANDILHAIRCPVETYGLKEGADWRGANFRMQGGEGFFDLVHRGRHVGEVRLPMIGRHNAENAVAVAALAIGMGLGESEVCRAFLGFKGIRRRQDVVGEKNGVTVIDDFAHHPTAIDLTIEAVKEAFPGSRVWAVFEPRSATSRRNVFQSAFPASFRRADRVVIAGLFSPDAIAPENRLDPERVARDIRALGGQADYIPDVDAIVDFIAHGGQAGDVVLVMSSGGFGGIHQKLLERL
jgi:UDP-N-acetylmuramate: L-alanyl-gamma-D-glutamyl-meso-diaminopimelate ligase